MGKNDWADPFEREREREVNKYFVTGYMGEGEKHWKKTTLVVKTHTVEPLEQYPQAPVIALIRNPARSVDYGSERITFLFLLHFPGTTEDTTPPTSVDSSNPRLPPPPTTKSLVRTLFYLLDFVMRCKQ